MFKQIFVFNFVFVIKYDLITIYEDYKLKTELNFLLITISKASCIFSQCFLSSDPILYQYVVCYLLSFILCFFFTVRIINIILIS